MQTAPTAVSIAKLALYIAVLILPGGSLVALVVWWVSRRWGKSAVYPADVRPDPVS